MDHVGRILIAGGLAAVAASGNQIGAWLGIHLKFSQKTIAVVMAFAAGTLIEALAVELAAGGAQDMITSGKSQTVAWTVIAIGFVVGGLAYSKANEALDHKGGHLRRAARSKAYLMKRYHSLPHAIEHLSHYHAPHLHGHASGERHLAGTSFHRHLHHEQVGEGPALPAVDVLDDPPGVSMMEHGLEPALKDEAGGSAPMAIFVGSLIDGIPGAVVIGAGFLSFATFQPTFFLATFLANLPQGTSSGAVMKRAGFPAKKINMLWLWGTLACFPAAAIGNAFLVGADPMIVNSANALAGGAILSLLASNMMPEAYEDGGTAVGLATITGFLTAFLFSAMNYPTVPDVVNQLQNR